MKVKSLTEMAMAEARTRDAVQAAVGTWRANGLRVGFVPTMGALHAGHLSLIEMAKENADRVVASIFVNPAQFAPGEDFDAYPRQERKDIEALAAAGCDLIYLPPVAEMYPPGSCTNVRVEGLSDVLDGRFRPHFFYGVATVVARLFAHVQPDIAVFGEKDFQQLQIIRRMVRDLGLPIGIVGAATIRDGDGLAQSSRNQYLTPDERRIAGAMFAALHRAAMRLSIGSPTTLVLDEARGHILRAGFQKLDYVSLVDPDTLEEVAAPELAPGTAARLLGAAWLGKTRLIDNVSVPT